MCVHIELKLINFSAGYRKNDFEKFLNEHFVDYFFFVV